MKDRLSKIVKGMPRLVPVTPRAEVQLRLILEKNLIRPLMAINKPYSEDAIETIVSKDLHDNGLGDYPDDILPELRLFLSELASGHIGQSLFIVRDALLKGNAAHFALEKHEESMPWQEGTMCDSDDWEHIDQAQRIRGIA